MATPNVGILTTAGKALIDKVNSGQAKISFSKIVFSSMDNSQLSDMQVKALTAIAPQEVVVSSPETTLDTNSGETRIRATGTNEKLADGVYVKTYGVFAKDDTGSEILYGVTVSPNPNYFPAYDGVTPQAVTYSYKTVIQETSNITMTNSNDVYASQEDLTEALQPYAKTVDVNQQLDKKVNITDMRKPASDVAGIEEVSAKQDKIGYTPADDSKVVHTTDMRKPASDVVGLEDITQTVLPDGTDFYTLINTAGRSLQYFVDGFPHAQTMINKPTSTLSGFILITTAVNNRTVATYNYTFLSLREVVTGNSYGAVITTDGTGKITVTRPWRKLSFDDEVAHLSGANNFDTVPTVNNNPLLLASSLPSDLARTGANQEFTGKNTFDTAPIDKTTGNPYITKDGVPSIPSDVARTSQQTNFPAGLKSGGIDVATAADLNNYYHANASDGAALAAAKAAKVPGIFWFEEV
ncbi:hypothetical protein AV935_09140 [Levilactobacillus brevis]|uniref:hypothetical protein n=1 Tax=Levilactobacillus brevis TaxID=1580 RepID=UPI0007618A1C|nr:hypothetical protein [Levilactobacillus brevis]KWU39889.1 hypothetical protein AV935_09140 [Levilactobacillus brevis]